MRKHFWLSEEQFARLQPLLPTDTRGVPRVDDRRVISGIVPCLAERVSVARCAVCLWPPQDAVQSVRALGTQGGLGAGVRRVGRGRRAARGADVGCDARQGPSIGRRRKRGAQRQAIGRSRGGRTTKIHVAVDEAGRPRRLILGPGHRGDGLVGPALVAELRRCAAWPTPLMTVMHSAPCSSAGAVSRLSPTTRRANANIPSTLSPTGSAMSSNAPSVASRIGAASPPATINSRKTIWPRSPWLPLSPIGYES